MFIRPGLNDPAELFPFDGLLKVPRARVGTMTIKSRRLFAPLDHTGDRGRVQVGLRPLE